jgi:RNA polymerase sigma factor (sigma-70 family)
VRASPHPDPRLTSISHRLDQLLQRFAARVRVQIESNRLMQQGIDADDVEQEVRIRLWRALERDPNAEFPASYIQKVVATVLVDALRRSQVRPAEALPEPEEGEAELPDAGARPERVAMDAEQIAKLGRCLEALPPRRRRPLQLYLQGYALQELADLNGLTLDAARKLVYRGLEELKQRLAALGMSEYEDDEH